MGRIRRTSCTPCRRSLRRGSRPRLENSAVHVQQQRVHGIRIRFDENSWRASQCQLPLPRRRAAVPTRQLRRRSTHLPLVPRRSRSTSGRSASEAEAAHRSRRWGRRPSARRAGIRGSTRNERTHGANHAFRRRHVHALHRRNDWHAEGGHVLHGRHDRRLRVNGVPHFGSTPTGGRQ